MGLHTVLVEFEVDVELCDFSTKELMDELMSRHVDVGFYLENIIDFLERSPDVPKEVIKPLKDWCRQPLADKHALARWLIWAAA